MQRPFPVPVSAGLFPRAARDGPAWRTGRPLRSICAALRALPARSPPRSPAMPGAGPL